MSQSYCDIHIRERGTGEWPALTIEIDATYNLAFIDSLKSLPPGTRIWDEASKRWRAHPDYLDNVIAMAKVYYRSLRQLEGDVITDLRTGGVIEQKGLFG